MSVSPNRGHAPFPTSPRWRRATSRLLLLAIPASLLLLASVQSAGAGVLQCDFKFQTQVVFFDELGDHEMSEAVNWSTGTLPGPDDVACVPADPQGGNTPVTLSTGSLDVGQFLSFRPVIVGGSSTLILGSDNLSGSDHRIEGYLGVGSGSTVTVGIPGDEDDFLAVTGDLLVQDGEVQFADVGVGVGGPTGVRGPNQVQGNLLQSGGQIAGQGSLTVMGNATWGGPQATNRMQTDLTVVSNARVENTGLAVGSRFTAGGLTLVGATVNMEPNAQIVAGSITQDGGVVTLNNSVNPAVDSSTWVVTGGGIVGGVGGINGSLDVTGGTLAPGASPGIVSVTGDLTIGPESTLAVEINGQAPGTGHDQVAVGGNTTIAGTVSATVAPAYQPATGTTFEIVNGGGDADVANATLVDTDPADGKALAMSSNGGDVLITATNTNVLPGGGGGGGATIGTAQQVEVGLLDVSVQEGDGGSQVGISAELSQAVSYDVVLLLDLSELASTGRGDATPAAFAQLDDILTIKAGDTNATLLADLVGDNVPEPDEQFQVSIISAEPANLVTIGNGFATVTVTDDDPPPNVFGLEPATFSDTCLIDPQGLGLQAKTDTVLSNSDMALAMLSCTGPPTGGTVVVSRDDNFADSLASGFLQADSPLMLMPRTGRIPANTLDFLNTIDPSSVVIVGGEAAVAPDVEQQIRDQGIDVTRRQGATRLETAIDIAATDAATATTAIVARAFPNPDASDPTQAFADAISAGGMAADLGYPVLLTDTEALSEATAAYLSSSQITDIFIMGGTSAISSQVEATLNDLMSGEVRRVTGANRFGTAVATASIRGTDSAADASEIILLEGQDESAWAAGFAAAYPSAQMGAPIVLLNGDTVPDATAAFLTSGTSTPTQFSGIASPPDDHAPLTCAAQDDACFAARRLLDLPGVFVTFDPPPLGPAVAGMPIGITLDRPLPADANLTVDGSCLVGPVTDLDGVRIRADLPPLPCTVVVTVTYPAGVVETVTSAYVVPE